MMAVPLQPTNNHVTVRYGREYCSFGLRNNISCVPVDDVRTPPFYAPFVLF
jgi:hypothetical protein